MQIVCFLIFTCAKIEVIEGQKIWRHPANKWLKILSNTNQNQTSWSGGWCKWDISPQRDADNLLSCINPIVIHGISYLFPNISDNINYNHCGYSCYPQLNSWSLSEVFSFSDFLHGEFHSLMTCSRSPPWSWASPLLIALLKQLHCTIRLACGQSCYPGIWTNSIEGFWYQVKPPSSQFCIEWRVSQLWSSGEERNINLHSRALILKLIPSIFPLTLHYYLVYRICH